MPILLSGVYLPDLRNPANRLAGRPSYAFGIQGRHLAAVNKNKLLDNATKYIQKGQIDRAIKELQKVIEADPGDVRTRLKLGDLFAKKNQNAEAADQYNLVAESYSKDGFYLKAVAVYKQILKLDSSLIDVHLKLGDLYHQLGLLSDAMSQYQIVAQHYDQKGMAKELLNTLRKMVELDPENIQSRKKLAEIVAREGQVSEAIAEFQKIAEDLKAKGRLDDLSSVLERIVHLDQTNLDVVRELAGLYLERGDPKRALAKLQLCFRANPHDLSTLEMLSKAFVALGQPEKAKSVYREIAKIHEAGGNSSARGEAYRAILQIDPGDADARAALEGRAPPAPSMQMEQAGAPMQFAQPSPAAQRMPEPARPRTPAPMQAPAPMAAQMGGGSGGGGDDAQTIQKLLTEADVYLKYGLLEKALDHLRGIVRRNPQNVDAHLKLKDVYLQHKDTEGAVAELIAVIELCMNVGDGGRAAEALEEGLQIAPGHPQLTSMRGQVGGGAPARGGWDSSADPNSSSQVEISIDAGDPEVMIEGGDAMGDFGGLDQVEISVDGDDGQIEMPDDVPVEIQVEEPESMTGRPFPGHTFDPNPSQIIDDSVDVSVVDDVAIDGDLGDGISIEDPEPMDIPPEAMEPVSREIPAARAPAPAPPPPSRPKQAEVVDLGARREEKSGRMSVPEPSALSPDQLLNELANAFEGTGDSDMGDRSRPSIESRFGVDDRKQQPALGSSSGLTDISIDMDVGDVDDGDLATDDRVAVDEPSRPMAAAKSAPASSGRAAAPPPIDEPVPPEVAEDVDEADFFVKQEIYDEAVAVYKRLLKKFPNNPGLTSRLARATALLNGEVVPSKAPAKAAPAARAPEPARAPARNAPPGAVAAAPVAAPVDETGGFDLAAELMAELDEIAEEDAGSPSFDENEQVSVGDVLREFRKGVDKQVGTEDKQARYDLGIAYREMGLLEEAIGEFEIASGDSNRRADCFNMVGMCQRDKGDLEAAIRSFSESIKTPGIQDKQKASFFYELAATLEAKGEDGKALQAYRQVQALDPGFRDVAEKIKKGGGGSGAPPAKKISYV